VKTINTTVSTDISVWARSAAPNAQRQGTALPFAAQYPTALPGAAAAGMTAHKTTDATVPEPRGRQR
jgi:hypothetical protein